MRCTLCPRLCGAERTETAGSGFCRMPAGPVVARAHTVRIGYVTDLLVARGFDRPRAEARARVAYAAYLGNRMLMHSRQSGDAPDAAALKREFLAAILG